MSRPGWALRAALRDAATANSPARVDERRRHAAACAQAIADRQAKYPILTAENADEAIRFQEQRIAELTR